jgi:ribosomal protein S18 acetylase RimI-like enzyme
MDDNRGMDAPHVRDLDWDADREWAEDALDEVGGRWLARRGEVVDATTRPGLVSERGDRRIGVLLYDASDEAGEVELLALATPARGAGGGTAMVRVLRERFPDRVIWVVTTNDNVDALRFYQRLGFRLREVRIGAIDEARRTLKPGIPEAGNDGVPIRDELELALVPVR